MLALTGAVGPFIEETDHQGYSSDACSYHRSVSGAAIKGMMPFPDLLIGTTNPCNWGCRQGTGARGLRGKGLREIGVPVLNLEVDCVDSRKDRCTPGSRRSWRCSMGGNPSGGKQLRVW